MPREPAVFSAGTAAADFALAVDAPVSAGASLIAQRFWRTLGGRAANVAVISRRLATPARLLGCVGEDELATAREGSRRTLSQWQSAWTRMSRRPPGFLARSFCTPAAESSAAGRR